MLLAKHPSSEMLGFPFSAAWATLTSSLGLQNANDPGRKGLMTGQKDFYDSFLGPGHFTVWVSSEWSVTVKLCR